MIQTQLISQQTADAVLQRLDALATKLGVTAEYMYGVYVKQARVEAIENSIATVLWIVAGYVLFLLAKWLLFKFKNDNEDDWPYVIGGISGLFAVVAVMIGFGCIYSAVGEWLNPQFWALTEIFKAVK